MDWAASTPLHPQVARAMRAAESAYGNPSAPHEEGRMARALIDDARTRIARVLGVKADELVFTASGTESNNLAVGWVREGAHVIASVFEHPSVGEPIAHLEHGRKIAVSYVRPNADGIITPDAVQKLLRPETALVSIVAVQSEIGTIQPLKEIARMLSNTRVFDRRPVLHSDACQGPMFLDVSPHTLGVDIATYDAQKIRGPKGVGLLWRRSSVTLEPVVRGGGQERRVRPGTENTVGIVGMAEAFELAAEGRSERARKVEEVRDYFVELLKKEIPQAELNGGLKHRIANNVNISIPGADGDYLAVLMDARGIAVSPRSACVASGTPSSAILALGKSDAAARGTVRFTFGPDVTKSDAKRAVLALKDALRVM
jgi:cysteine desulfurase